MAALLLAPSACLDDLPAPTTCPPSATHPLGDCAPTLQGLVMDAGARCLDQSEVECITGPRKGCACVADECPALESACYPHDDCPAAVFEHVGHEAACHHLAPSDIGFGTSEASQCVCGCAGCAAVCDGIGPALGVIADDQFDFVPPIFELGDRLPDRGRLGVYVRVRGVANFTVLAFHGELGGPMEPEPLQAYVVFTPLETEFSEQPIFDQVLYGDAYRWTEPSRKPTLLVIFPGTDGTGTELLELDCVVPFVMPP